MYSCGHGSPAGNFERCAKDLGTYEFGHVARSIGECQPPVVFQEILEMEYRKDEEMLAWTKPGCEGANSEQQV